MSADLIIHNGLVVTMDPQRRIIPDGVVVIAGERIVAAGDAASRDQYEAPTMIDAEGGIVMPGMVNTHCHAAMTVFRGLGDDIPNRLQRYIFPLEAQTVNEDLVYWGSLLGILEMIEAGVTTFADMYYFEEVVAKAAAEAGMRAVLGQTVIGFTAPDCPTPDEAIAQAQRTAADYAGHPLVRIALAPHAPYSLSEQELARVAAASREADLPVLIHLSETQHEHDTIMRAHGKTPVEYLASVGLLTERLTAAHCVFVDDRDLRRLADAGVGVSHNAVSNIKAGKGVAPILRMAEHGIPVGLGSDGAMSGNTLDILAQMGTAAKLQKLTARDRTIAPAADMVALATIDGARALHKDAEIGSLEPGKRADIAIVDTTASHMRPLHDVYAALVYATRPSDVRTTVINGQVVMHDREVGTVSRNRIYAEIDRLATNIRGIVATL